MADRISGAAMRRRQRRLRSWWRHEQAVDRGGLGHVLAPKRTAPEDGQGRGVCHDPEYPHSPAGALRSVVGRRAQRGAA